MKLNKSKKGFVVDTIMASGALFVVVLVIAVVGLILFNFNEEIQNQSIIGDAAKEAASYSEGTFPSVLGYAFMTIFLGFVIYTIVTAILINNIHPIFWIVGFVMILISTIITSTIKLIYGEAATIATLAPYISAIPAAAWYFSNMEIINVIWMGIQGTIIYFRMER